jgi:hypothetical protein
MTNPTLARLRPIAMRVITPEKRCQHPPESLPHIETLCKMAEAQGSAWAKRGDDVQERIRRHSPHWPGGRNDRLRLIASVLAGAGRRGGGQ